MSNKSIEAVINEILTGDTQRNALDFVAHLRANEIPLEESENYWEVKYKDKVVCYMMITGSDEAPGPWTIWSDQEPGAWVAWSDGDNSSEGETFSVDGQIKDIAWGNVNFCASCGSDCSPGKRKIILGKAFDGVCSSALAFTNPDASMVICAKKMIDARKSDILKSM